MAWKIPKELRNIERVARCKLLQLHAATRALLCRAAARMISVLMAIAEVLEVVSENGGIVAKELC